MIHISTYGPIGQEKLANFVDLDGYIPDPDKPTSWRDMSYPESVIWSDIEWDIFLTEVKIALSEIDDIANNILKI